MREPDSHDARPVVAVETVRGDLRSAVRRALEAAGWKTAVPRGSDVSLKVNLGWDLFLPGSITSPSFVEAVILEIRHHVGRIYVVESDQVLEDVEKAFRRSGMAAVCARQDVEWVNMSREPTVLREFPEHRVLRHIELPRQLEQTLLITLPVMKTHAKTGITGALKNQWGCLSTMRHEYHLVLDEALAELNHVLRPVLSVMDATVGLEGNGPKSGRPRVADRVLCSTDPVALDTVQAMVMGLNPIDIPHLARCAARGIGETDSRAIRILGFRPGSDPLRFLPARHNAVSRIETLLRRSFFKRLFFNTPLFRICLGGAKLYYRLWTAFRAPAHWRRIRAHPLYGPQWEAGWPGLEAQGRRVDAPGQQPLP